MTDMTEKLVAIRKNARIVYALSALSIILAITSIILVII